MKVQKQIASVEHGNNNTSVCQYVEFYLIWLRYSNIIFRVFTKVVAFILPIFFTKLIKLTRAFAIFLWAYVSMYVCMFASIYNNSDYKFRYLSHQEMPA